MLSLINAKRNLCRFTVRTKVSEQRSEILPGLWHDCEFDYCIWEMHCLVVCLSVLVDGQTLQILSRHRMRFKGLDEKVGLLMHLAVVTVAIDSLNKTAHDVRHFLLRLAYLSYGNVGFPPHRLLMQHECAKCRFGGVVRLVNHAIGVHRGKFGQTHLATSIVFEWSDCVACLYALGGLHGDLGITTRLLYLSLQYLAFRAARLITVGLEEVNDVLGICRMALISDDAVQESAKTKTNIYD